MAPLEAAKLGRWQVPGATVVTPTHNRRDSLCRLLQALARQDVAAGTFEAVVVADGCTDGTVNTLRQLETTLPYQLRVVDQPQSGPAAARNRAIEAAHGDIIVFLDDDVVPVPGCLSTHIAYHERDERAVVIGPLSPGSADRPVWVRWEDDRVLQQYQAMLAGKYKPTPRQFYTGNSSVRKCWIQEAGGFDGRLRRAEDVELAFRLQDLGLRFYFDPRADGLHQAERTYRSWQSIPRQYGNNDVLMARERGRAHLLHAIGREFHRRQRPTRWLARLCVGHPLRFRLAMAVLGPVIRGGDRMGLDHLSDAACSGVWNVAYWQGLAETLGGAQAFWSLIDSASETKRPSPALRGKGTR